MSRVRIRLNAKGIREVLHSQELEGALKGKSSEIQGRCGNGYVSDTYNAGSRLIASVSTKSYRAKKDNLKNNTILKAAGV